MTWGRKLQKNQLCWSLDQVFDTVESFQHNCYKYNDLLNQAVSYIMRFFSHLLFTFGKQFCPNFVTAGMRCKLAVHVKGQEFSFLRAMFF